MNQRDPTRGSPILHSEPAELTPAEYECFREMIYREAGIHLGPHKMQLLRARLGKRMRRGGFPTYQAYFDHVQRDQSGQELYDLIDAISTNTTHLFRERQHFDFLTKLLNDWRGDQSSSRDHGLIRIWSAGCSSGEEPFSIAMTCDDILRGQHRLDFRILATDISTRVLARARSATYDAERMRDVQAEFISRYFERVPADGETRFQVVAELRKKVAFARLNLMSDSFPFRHALDVIFCRNVMIYFDQQTQTALVNKFARHLRPGGYLLIGHSESLNGLRHPLNYVQPTIYQRHGSG